LIRDISNTTSDSETSDEGSLDGHDDDKGECDEEFGSETYGAVERANGEGSTRVSKCDEEPKSGTDGIMDGANFEGSTQASEGV
jgi:hypothetical protein